MMKKAFGIVAFSFLLVFTAVAQPRAIGGRLGTLAEVSYQHTTHAGQMIDLTAGTSNYFLTSGYAEVACMYDWVFNIAGSWNWYVGPGVGVGYYWHGYADGYSHLRLAVGAQIGVEYQFRIPLNISLDWRPMYNLMFLHRTNGAESGLYYGDLYGIALGLRYRF